MKKTAKVRSPTLDSLLMIEKHIRKHDGEYKKKKLWSTLPRKMMYQTFCVAITYLYNSRKISIDSVGKFGWIWYPHIKHEGLISWDEVKRQVHGIQTTRSVSIVAPRR